MSLHVEFEPHSYYMGFAIEEPSNGPGGRHWHAYTDDGNTGFVIEREATNLQRLKLAIREYHIARHTGYGERIVKGRLAYLRNQICDECISYSEINELESLRDYIDPNDVLLLEWAGVGEGI